MNTKIGIDYNRGRQLAALLYNCFSSTGIHRRTEMPEDILPKGLKKGTLEHIFFITLSVSIDYYCAFIHTIRNICLG